MATQAESVPAITLTDPNNHDTAPSPAFSPTKDAPPPDLNGILRASSGRPATPTSKGNSNRPESPSSNTWTSPGRLIRTLSNNASTQSGSEINNGEAPPAIDPLSEHILKRTNTPFTVPSSASTARPATADSGPPKNDRQSSEQNSAPAVQGSLRRVETSDSSAQAQASKDLRKGVKAVSFITKLMGNKKKDDENAIDDKSESNEGRPEGNDAEVFAQPVDNIGFSPKQHQPPAYIKMRSKYKKERDFDRVFLAQELDCRKPKLERQNSSNKLRRKSSAPAEANTIWAMEFSRDGKYLAAAGVDGIVRIWAVLSSSDDRQKHEKQESNDSEANGADAHAEHLSAPVFQRRPIREYQGHTSTVLDLSWSKNNFLLSSSMDKTVRLWHVTRSECLCTFKHNDFVPSIAFHPKDDRFFLAGSLDSKLRLWSIPDKSVAFATQLPDMITAVAFTPDGKHTMAGCLSGVCMFYETEGMKYQSQVHVRSTRGQNAKGSKITGISAHHDSRGDVKLLITSNDSRIRLYNFRDKSLELKFRGNENNASQIRASLSDDGQYVVCGSEDRKAYIWSMGPAEGEKRDKRPMEMFEAHNTITTVVCFAPAKTRHHLAKSEDPVYDLCNPPPVTLMSRAERAESQSSSRPPTENGSIQNTPAELEGRFERPKESPGFLSRHSHKDGNIIVTADYSGRIKVFRQDCAWIKRRLDEWDRSSLFSKRTGRLSRTGSKASQSGLYEGRTSLSMSGPSDRILSWRQGVASTPSIADSQRRASKNDSRSISPRKSVDRKREDSRKESNAKSGLSKWESWTADMKGTHPAKADVLIDTAQARKAADDSTSNRTPDSPTRSIKDDNPLMLQGGRSYLFWDTDEWKARSERWRQMHHDSEQMPLSPVPSPGEEVQDGNHLAVRPPLGRGETNVSQLSDERSSVSEYSDAHEEKETEMKCRHCGSRSFSARKLKTGTSLVCTKCGKQA